MLLNTVLVAQHVPMFLKARQIFISVKIGLHLKTSKQYPQTSKHNQSSFATMASFSGRKANEIFQGQALLYRRLYGFIDSMCVKWCVELGMPDIIQNHSQPITLHALVPTLQVPPTKISGVERLMRYLSHNGYF